MDNIINTINEALNQLTTLSKEDKEKKNKDIIEKIYYYIGLTDKIEERREKIQNFSYQYLAILITATGFLFNYKDKIPNIEFYFIISIIITQIISSSVIIVFFIFQSKYRYPFLEIDKFSNQWKWFYYGNKFIAKINTNPFYSSKKETDTENYLKGLNFVVNEYKNENLDTEIKSNIIQFYLLQVHNYYKNKFYLQLFNIRKYSIYLIIIIVSIYSLIKIISLSLPSICEIFKIMITKYCL